MKLERITVHVLGKVRGSSPVKGKGGGRGNIFGFGGTSFSGSGILPLLWMRKKLYCPKKQKRKEDIQGGKREAVFQITEFFIFFC